MGRAGSSSPHPWPEGLDQTPDQRPPSLEPGQMQWGAPCRAVGHLVYPSPGSPISQAALLAGLGPRALWLKGGKEGGTGLEGGKSDAKEKMHFLMTQSSRIRSLLASWMPPALSLGWSPPPDASPALTQHILPTPPRLQGPLSSWRKPYTKRPTYVKVQLGELSSGNPWSLEPHNVSVWLRSHILDQPALSKPPVRRLQGGPRHFCLGPLALARMASPEEPPGGSPWEALRTDPTARSGAAQTPRQGAETQSPGSVG